jgi:Ca2+-binding RTX toxin-like protein
MAGVFCGYLDIAKEIIPEKPSFSHPTRIQLRTISNQLNTTKEALKMATINGTNGNDTGFFGAVQPELLGIPNPLNISDDLLLGLAGNDELNGFGGNDTLNGGADRDTMNGGNGNDLYIVDNASDVTNENTNSGIDTVNANFTAVNYALSSNIENLNLTGAITNGIGNSLNNIINGNNLNNLLDGGGGRDTLRGGFGNDIYIVDNAGDVVTELVSQGVDTIRTSVSYTLSANVENGELTGNSAASLTGNNLSNSLTGNGAANQLDGGSGVDTMSGGFGNDTYYVNVANDQVIELFGRGTDRVVSSAVSYTLSANVEELQLANVSTVSQGVGNALNNKITGNQYSNVLDGGAGNDTMVGGAGSDSYTVNSAGDVVTELAGQGVDIIQTNLASFSLFNTLNVENLTFTGNASHDGSGNQLDNVLRGAAGGDNLFGSAGNDRLYGFDGNDRLKGGTGNDLLNGEAGDDQLNGVESPSLFNLAGRGELDMLTGGAGADTFFFAANGQQFYNDGTIGNGISDFGLVTDFSIAQGDRISLLTGQQYVLGDAIQLGTGIQGTSISMAFSNQANEVVGIIQGVNLGSGTFSSTTNTNAAFIFS